MHWGCFWCWCVFFCSKKCKFLFDEEKRKLADRGHKWEGRVKIETKRPTNVHLHRLGSSKRQRVEMRFRIAAVPAPLGCRPKKPRIKARSSNSSSVRLATVSAMPSNIDSDSDSGTMKTYWRVEAGPIMLSFSATRIKRTCAVRSGVRCVCVCVCVCVSFLFNIILEV